MGQQIGPGVRLVEYGSGSSVKTRYLLDALSDAVAYVPVDISEEHLRRSAGELAADYPQIEVLPVCADFTKDFDLPLPTRISTAHRYTHTAVYFPGSTIGNFRPDQAAALLRRIATTCGSGGGLLIGIDLKKARETIEHAYNDRLGVTAQFNLNLLHRMNRELQADFDVSQFSHQAVYNAKRGRIEMHLVSQCAQSVTIGGDLVEFAAGETICTEHSHKYTVSEFAALASTAGLSLHHQWTDQRGMFAVLHFVVETI
jgi:dimethylhistidine N-methyltransferase